jgi:hypothetical protein
MDASIVFLLWLEMSAHPLIMTARNSADAPLSRDERESRDRLPG